MYNEVEQIEGGEKIMIYRRVSVGGVMSRIVPITRFNKGEANKIFEEVKQGGTKVVLKNNDPVCVLVTPEEYEAMVDKLTDYELALEAERRLDEGGRAYTIGEVMDRFGITERDLADVEVELE